MQQKWSRGAVALALAAAVLSSGCGVLGVGEEPRDLREARERWEDAGIGDYTFDLQRVCFCGEVGPVRIVVRNGHAVARTVISTGDPLPEEAEPWYPTVPGLFDFVEDAIDRDAHRLDARYDPQRGYPLELFVDYEERIADEEMGYTISGFTVQ